MVEHQLEIYESILKRDARQKPKSGRHHHLRGIRPRQRRGRRHFESIIQSVQELDGTMPITVLAKTPRASKSGTG